MRQKVRAQGRSGRPRGGRLKLAILVLALGATLSGCATTAEPAQDGRVTVSLNQPARFGGLELVPLRIVEESRCPAEVRCIQAGTVRIEVRSSEDGNRRDLVMTLREPQRLAGGFATLAAVCPYPRQPGPIAPAAYRFVLAFGATAPPAEVDSRC